MKKIYTTALCLLFGCITVSGQVATNTESKDSTNIYYQAFLQYCSGAPEGHRETLLVEEDNITTKSIPRRMGAFDIEILNYSAIKNRLKKETSLTVIRIIPLRMEGGVFFIDIIPFGVTKSSKGLNYGNSGGYGIEFRYNCSSKKFELLAVKRGSV
ncbi:hypothetical protein [Chitinophaga varians]|uniref:hypothetical protein n=1 Tax=Chitinophaga varians TaxID=2202339 RepID=UPI00165FDA2F|nr:hypothetical protein [Chitinophaga varians]MBC9909298.1 hypothetical protein [Chitinophaga varians]